MATTKKKKSKGKKKSSSKGGFNLNRILGIGAGVFGSKQLDKIIPDTWDPKMKAVAKIAIGEYAPGMDIVKNLAKNDDITRGAGSGLTAMGMSDLMTEMNIGGMGDDKEDSELVVAIEGIDDIDTDHDEDSMDDDDLNTVNEDVLGDDDDDMDVINEDVLGDDDDY